MTESPVYPVSAGNPTDGFVFLPAVSGLAYKVYAISVNLQSGAGLTGGSLKIMATSPRNGALQTICRASVVPASTDAVNFQQLFPGGITMKAGTSIYINYFGADASTPKLSGDFASVGVTIFYSEVD